MFTGIIESTGTLEKIDREGTNYHFTIASPISDQLKIDQSISHNGVCLTVIAQEKGKHVITAIEETMQRTNLGELQVGDIVNLERAMVANSRLDGHIVQGHVDGTATCIDVKSVDGSWYFSFEYTPTKDHMLVDKGSVCINGVSLTVVNPIDNKFSVAIIPYTYENTTFKNIKIGSTINLEFDIIGKYISKHIDVYMKAMVK